MPQDSFSLVVLIVKKKAEGVLQQELDIILTGDGCCG
jgi:hypothetical protein